MESVQSVLSMQHISKRFFGTTVLDDVSLDCLPGEVYAIVGENGAGVVDVAMLPTLAARRDKIGELTRPYGQVIVDECHHLAAGTYDDAVKRVGAQANIGGRGVSPPGLNILYGVHVHERCDGVRERRPPVELRLRHTNSLIMAQGCDLEVPLVGERPPVLPPLGPVPGAAPGDS
jgi:hypothetical protein